MTVNLIHRNDFLMDVKYFNVLPVDISKRELLRNKPYVDFFDLSVWQNTLMKSELYFIWFLFLLLRFHDVLDSQNTKCLDV
jgi:hypothetical protein